MIYTTKEQLMQDLALRRMESLHSGKKCKVGFVPTMGALHKGHLSLVENALKDNDVVVVSIFVNPTQFDNPKDLAKYPRVPEKDLAVLEGLSQDLLIYLPPVSDIYGSNIVSESYNFDGLEHEMEGKHRKGHFDGVGTVLKTFFKIVNPDKAYFGEKDFQQLQIVRKLVQSENLDLEIIGCPIFREENGLAMSSRNERLSPQEFKDAAFIYKVLSEVREKFPTSTFKELDDYVAERFLSRPFLKLEYFQIANEDTLRAGEKKDNATKYRAFIAVFVGDVRLIDNISLN